MRLSVAIVNWNTTDLLKACLISIRDHPPKGDYEITVVENNSDDFDAEAFRRQFPDVHLIVNPADQGYARGNNQAIETSTGDYVLLLNPDTEVTEDALETLLVFMESHADAAAAGAKLVRPDGSIDLSVRSFPYPGPIAWEFLGLSRLFPKSRRLGAYRMTYFTYDKPAEVDQPMGSALILSRHAINKVGLLDEAFPIFFNEVDWLYRAKENGYRVYFVPDAAVIHHGGASTSQVKRSAMLRESHESLMKFYAKHFRGRVFAPVYYFTLACIKLGKLLRR